MRRASSWLALLAFAVGLVACDGTKREAASLVAAVDRYRQAPVGAKSAPEGDLEAVACADPEVCAAKVACVAAARPTVRGYALKAEVESALAELHDGAIDRDQAAAKGLPEKLDEASRLLDEGHAALTACDAKIVALRLRYGL